MTKSSSTLVLTDFLFLCLHTFICKLQSAAVSQQVTGNTAWCSHHHAHAASASVTCIQTFLGTFYASTHSAHSFFPVTSDNKEIKSVEFQISLQHVDVWNMKTCLIVKFLVYSCQSDESAVSTCKIIQCHSSSVSLSAVSSCHQQSAEQVLWEWYHKVSTQWPWQDYLTFTELFSAISASRPSV